MAPHSRWSEPIEAMLQLNASPCCDVLVVGSGYGGSFAARELAAPGVETWVVERGREYALGEFPEDIGHLPGHLRMQRGASGKALGNAQALLNVQNFEQVAVLTGSGLGGGSLVNAGVAFKPAASTFGHAPWPGVYRPGGARHGALLKALDEVVCALEAAPLERAAELPKFQALSRLGGALQAGSAQPVDLTISGTKRTNAHGVEMEACVRCGNCFTGCNVGAKGSLATNLIPAAHRRGARFFVGGHALRVEPLATSTRSANGRSLRWRVHFECSTGSRNTAPVEFTIDAHTVVVSAGSLGSTELLLRSAQVPHSERLGAAFSTNGDVVAMGWRQRRAVNAVSAPEADGTEPSRDVGPTISATLRVPLTVEGVPQEILLQDGAIPSALAQATSTLGHTLSTLHRYVQDTDARFPGTDDPLALPRDAARHAQLLLAMGQDASNGQILLRAPTGNDPAAPHGLELDVRWPAHDKTATAGHAAYYQAVHNALGRAHAAGGFDGGDYLPNPLWRPAPDGFSDIIAGSQLEKSVTVHPLGGCAMGDNGTQGAVDWRGAVFKGAGSEVHAGLHVLDGAIVPRALGVNPFVTISALSMLAARDIAGELAQPDQAPTAQPAAAQAARPQPRVEVATRAGADGKLRFRIHEHLLGGTEQGHLPDWARQLLNRHDPAQSPGAAMQPRAFIAAVEMEVDLQQWLAEPSTRWDASLSIYANPLPGWPSIHSEALKGEPLLRGAGQVSLLAFERASVVRRVWRWLLAFGAFQERRPGNLLRYLGPGWLKKLCALARAGWLHTNHRTLDYHFTLLPQGRAMDHPLEVVARGSKLLAYRPGARTLWEALTLLDFELRTKDEGTPWKLGLRVDLADLVSRLRLQIRESSSTPASMVGLAAFASLWLRALMQTHFWSLRGLDYGQYTPPALPPHPPLKTAGGAIVRPQEEVLKAARRSGAQQQIGLQLTVYRHPEGGRHVLFIHGLAHGSGVYATDTVDTSMAGHFLRAGYTVWLLDNRMSNRLRYARGAHTMDDIAHTDIPAAIDRVHAQAGGQAIDVFAHCVGAGAFAMSALQARFDTTKVRAAIIHAVHPWVVPSVSNRFSGALAALYRNLLTGRERISPLLPAQPDAADELLDRFAATLAWTEEERSLHEAHRESPGAGCAICNRMTAFYGREWVHANLDPRTHERLGELVGVAGVEVFRQLYFIVLRERLTNRDGENAYLLQDNFRQNWHFPTLFVHGLDNQVFDPRGAARSWNRLRRIFAGQPQEHVVRTFLRKGYGHMDFLFGKHAHRDIYPHLTRFLEQPAAFEDITDGCHIDPERPCPDGQSSDTDLADRDFTTPIRPLTGPMLQIEHGPKGQRRLVIWVEQYLDTTSTPIPPELRIGGAVCPAAWITQLPGVVESAPSPARPPTGQGYYWTCVLEESASLRFASLPPISLVLRSLPQGSGVAGDAHAVAESPPIALDLAARPWWQRFAADGQTHTCTSFLASSCRWPGLAFERSAIDALAGDMAQHIDHASAPVQALLLLGDQIYADATANIAETTEPDERGAQRYRESWGSPATRQLFARLPVWLVVDDHEFDDNLDGADRATADSVRGQRFLSGFLAATAYQSRFHRPGLPRLSVGPQVYRVERGLWHCFEVGGIPAFAADTRTERSPRTLGNWRHARIMHDEQMEAIEDWLTAHPKGPKLLCSGSVFALPENRFVAQPATCIAADNWLGYPASWRRLVRFIVKNEIEGLIFVAGDYHLSALVEIELSSQGKSVKALNLVCSAWNASLPFANAQPSDFSFDQPVRVPGSDADAAMVCTARFASDAQRQFSKVTVTCDPGNRGTAAVAMDVYGPGNVLAKELRAQLPVGG
ncbi:cholesterol oxidase [Acidovorax soli]|uniref:Cholesterol oxidase n=1 Tax=Acidovorax soli TaxID=592050 RepID=A0A7X0U8F6_9BURK|nr:alkaline phosphatase D family protein [Acidovorax soli]MBB6558435.1 cholesterol oxidase [Acidovorax soli]